jgi:hypothetical protein
MSNTVTEKITVSNLSKYGFQVGTEYINYSKNLSDSDKARVVPGAVFDAELFVADSNKRYLNKILSIPTVDARDLPKVDAERAKRFTPKFTKKEDSNSMSRDDWDKKDKRIARAGVIQAAVQAVAPVVALENLFDEASKLADQMLEYTRRENA